MASLCSSTPSTFCSSDPIIQQCYMDRNFIQKQTVYKVAALTKVIELIKLLEDESIPTYNWEPEKELSMFFLKGEVFKKIGLPPSTKPLTSDHLIKYLSLEKTS